MIVVPIEAHGGFKMESENERVQRFVQAFESNYGRKPTLQDAEGNFRLRVAQDMDMSVGGARYYLRLAAELDPKKEPDTSD
jgi:hypothetical protein